MLDKKACPRGFGVGRVYLGERLGPSSEEEEGVELCGFGASILLGPGSEGIQDFQRRR